MFTTRIVVIGFALLLGAESADAVRPSEAMKGRPVLVMHGTNDPMVPAESAQHARDQLLPLGLGVTLREFDMGHEISPEALRALLEWFEDKVFGMIRPSLIIPGS